MVEEDLFLVPSWLLGKASKDEAGEDEAENEASRTPRNSRGFMSARSNASRGGRSPASTVKAMANLIASPKALTGTATDSRHRVTQVCLGSAHGMLLTDAGIVFTWGDNRYGQLGRSPVLKEENSQAFPVVGLLGEEVLQVACGTHHCLALVAPGLVWSWGRNKAGQLGVGDLRDRVEPTQVCHASSSSDSFGSGHQLGSTSPESRILTVSAGMNSSVAAALSSDVWQWGEISSTFKEAKSEVKEPDARAATAAAPTNKTERIVKKDRPHLVFKRESFRTGMRPSRLSISEMGCKVLDKEIVEDQNRLFDLVEDIRQLQEAINKERLELSAMDKEKRKRDEAETRGGGDLDNMSMLQDAIGTLERDLMLVERDIEAHTKSLLSCDLKQAQNRNSLQALSQQGTSLRDKQDKLSLQIFSTPKGSSERRKLEEHLSETQESVNANNNTRMTLLDQRADIDKQRQLNTLANNERRKQREKIKKRMETVQDLRKSTKASSSGTSDNLVKLLQMQTIEVSEHFHRRPTESEFLTSMKIFEHDSTFLRGVEERMKDMADSPAADPARAQRGEKVNGLLVDLVDLRRGWGDLLKDKWRSEGLDLSCFFKGSAKPQPGSGGYPSVSLADSLVISSRIPGGQSSPIMFPAPSLRRGPDAPMAPAAGRSSMRFNSMN